MQAVKGNNTLDQAKELLTSPNVTLLITSLEVELQGKKKQTVLKWSDTCLSGRLTLYQLEWHETPKYGLRTPPAVLLTIQNDESETIFKYELPLNFTFMKDAE